MSKFKYLIIWVAVSVPLELIGMAFGDMSDRGLAISFGITVTIALGDIAGKEGG